MILDFLFLIGPVYFPCWIKYKYYCNSNLIAWQSLDQLPISKGLHKQIKLLVHLKRSLRIYLLLSWFLWLDAYGKSLQTYGLYERPMFRNYHTWPFHILCWKMAKHTLKIILWKFFNNILGHFSILCMKGLTPQNGQIHSSNSLAIADELLVCWINFVGLALKWLKSTMITRSNPVLYVILSLL